jgi:hypothetical protein
VDKKEAQDIFYKLVSDTPPDTARSLPLDELEKQSNSLHLALPWLEQEAFQRRCRDRLLLLQSLIELKRGASQHGQMMRRAGWALFWAIVAGIGTVALVLQETPLSKLLHVRSSRPPQKQQSKDIPSDTPKPTPTPSDTPTTSPIPLVTNQSG